MNVAIVGSRTFDDYELLKDAVSHHTYIIYKIISGGAKGADRLGARYAKENGIELIEHLPDWDKHGKSAGYKRNKLIVDDCDILLAFWDGESKGTKHSIDLAKKANKTVKIITF